VARCSGERSPACSELPNPHPHPPTHPAPCPSSPLLQVVNQHLLHDLTRLSLWNPELKNELVAANGSVQELDLPMHLKVGGGGGLAVVLGVGGGGSSGAGGGGGGVAVVLDR
jgi:hypothetical protein